MFALPTLRHLPAMFKMGNWKRGELQSVEGSKMPASVPPTSSSDYLHKHSLSAELFSLKESSFCPNPKAPLLLTFSS